MNTVATINAETKLAEALNLSKELHKTLVLGQTRYVCRWGTLSDGHEKITDAQRFYQSVREMYHLACSIQDNKAQAMIAEGELLELQESADAMSKSAAKAMIHAGSILRARTKLASLNVTIDDQMRMLDEYYSVYKELKPVVEAKYPKGIEQAEQENWEAVARYRAAIEQATGTHQHLRHVPLDPEAKARIGIEMSRPELLAWYATREKDRVNELARTAPNVPGTNRAPGVISLVRQLLEAEETNENVLAPVR